MDLHDFVGFVLAVLLLEVTPGPNMAWLAGISAIEGRLVGLAAVVGIAIGLSVNSLLGALGVGALIMADPVWQTALRAVGAAAMGWLAVSTWREAGAPLKARERRSSGMAAAFAVGVMVNLINPKSVLFFVAVVPPFLHGRMASLPLAMALAAVSVGIATVIHLGIVAAASRGQDWLARSGYVRRLQRAMAVLMAGLAGWLVVSLLGQFAAGGHGA